MDSETVEEERGRLLEEIDSAIENRSISRDEITIVAVTKGFGVDVIEAAYEAGFHNVGENRVKQALTKKKELSDSIVEELEWHFVGHLQSNKVKRILGEFDLLHSVDRQSLIDELDKRLSRQGMTQQVLMQVNVSGEESKHGASPNEAPELMDDILSSDTLDVQGLMTMAPYTDDKSVLRSTFSKCRTLRDDLEDQFDKSFPCLSMGMTNDYRIALEEGSTCIRLGRRLFGERPQ